MSSFAAAHLFHMLTIADGGINFDTFCRLFPVLINLSDLSICHRINKSQRQIFVKIDVFRKIHAEILKTKAKSELKFFVVGTVSQEN